MLSSCALISGVISIRSLPYNRSGAGAGCGRDIGVSIAALMRSSTVVTVPPEAIISLSKTLISRCKTFVRASLIFGSCISICLF